MTPARKAELEGLAVQTVSSLGPVKSNDRIVLDKYALYDAITKALQHVEGEAFEQVAKHADYLESLSRRDDLSEAEAYENIADWCRTQAKETI